MLGENNQFSRLYNSDKPIFLDSICILWMDQFANLCIMHRIKPAELEVHSSVFLRKNTNFVAIIKTWT